MGMVGRLAEGCLRGRWVHVPELAVGGHIGGDLGFQLDPLTVDRVAGGRARGQHLCSGQRLTGAEVSDVEDVVTALELAVVPASGDSASVVGTEIHSSLGCGLASHTDSTTCG